VKTRRAVNAARTPQEPLAVATVTAFPQRAASLAGVFFCQPPHFSQISHTALAAHLTARLFSHPFCPPSLLRHRDNCLFTASVAFRAARAYVLAFCRSSTTFLLPSSLLPFSRFFLFHSTPSSSLLNPHRAGVRFLHQPSSTKQAIKLVVDSSRAPTFLLHRRRCRLFFLFVSCHLHRKNSETSKQRSSFAISHLQSRTNPSIQPSRGSKCSIPIAASRLFFSRALFNHSSC
jgi:hypothetical protein